MLFYIILIVAEEAAWRQINNPDCSVALDLFCQKQIFISDKEALQVTE